MSSKYEESEYSALPSRSGSKRYSPVLFSQNQAQSELQPPFESSQDQQQHTNQDQVAYDYSLVQNSYSAFGSWDSVLNKDICRLLGIPDAPSVKSSEEGKWSALLLDTVPTPDTIVTIPLKEHSIKGGTTNHIIDSIPSSTDTTNTPDISLTMSNDTLDLLTPRDIQYENTLYFRNQQPPQSARSSMRQNPYLLLEGHHQVPAKYSQFILRQLSPGDLLADLDHLSRFTDSESNGGGSLFHPSIMTTTSGDEAATTTRKQFIRHGRHNSETGSQVTIFSTRDQHFAMNIRRNTSGGHNNNHRKSVKSMTRSDGILDLKAAAHHNKRQLYQPQDNSSTAKPHLTRSKAIKNKTGGYLYRLKVRMLRLAAKIKKFKFYSFKVKSKRQPTIKQHKPKTIQLTRNFRGSISSSSNANHLVHKISNMEQVRMLLNKPLPAIKGNTNNDPTNQDTNTTTQDTITTTQDTTTKKNIINTSTSNPLSNPLRPPKLRHPHLHPNSNNSRLMDMSPSYERFSDMYELSKNRKRQNLLKFQNEQRHLALEWDFVQLWQSYLFYVFCKRMQLRFEINQFKQFLSMEYARMRKASNHVSERSNTIKSSTVASCYDNMSISSSSSSTSSSTTTSKTTSMDARFKQKFNRRSMLGEMLDYDSDLDTETASITTLGSQSYASNAYGAINNTNKRINT